MRLHAPIHGSTLSPVYLDFSAVGLLLDFVPLAIDQYKDFEAALDISLASPVTRKFGQPEENAA